MDYRNQCLFRLATVVLILATSCAFGAEARHTRALITSLFAALEATGPGKSALLRKSATQILRDGGFVRSSLASTWNIPDTGPAAAARVLARMEHARTGKPPSHLPVTGVQNALFAHLALLSSVYASDLNQSRAASEHLMDLLSTAPEATDISNFLTALLYHLGHQQGDHKKALALAATTCRSKTLSHRFLRAALLPAPPTRPKPGDGRSLEAVLWVWHRAPTWEAGLRLAKKHGFSSDETALLLFLGTARHGPSFVPTRIYLKTAHCSQLSSLCQGLCNLASDNCRVPVAPLKPRSKTIRSTTTAQPAAPRTEDSLPPVLP